MATGGSYYNGQAAQRYAGRQRTGSAGLPASARDRLRRFESTQSHTSFLSVPSAAGLRAVGLDPIGDVMGCIAVQVRHDWIGSCTPGSARYQAQRSRDWQADPSVVLAANRSNRVSYVGLLTRGYRTALDRLRAEARALGADGVVDIRLTRTDHDELREVVAIGTAVRARSSRRPSQPFTTDLPGTDVAKLMLSGWVPVSLHVAVQLGIRHDDYRTLGQASRSMNRSNVEVRGYSELLQRTRGGATALLRSAIASAGADGGLLSDLVTTNWSKNCLNRPQNSDHVACTVAVGTSVVRFGSTRRPAPKPLSIMPVSAKGAKR